MLGTPAILIADSAADVRSLSMLLLQRELPDAIVTAAADALALMEALRGGAPDLAIVAADLEWFDVGELVATIKDRYPRTAIVVFTSEADVTLRALGGGLALDGIVHKSPAGFLRLGRVASEALARVAHRGPHAAAMSASAPPNDDIRQGALMFSHDLKEPVQQIIRLTKRGNSTEDNRAGSRALHQVRDCAERANRMLEGMVDYLRVGGQAHLHATVDLNQCLNKALDNLRSWMTEAGAEIRAAALPAIVGDERELTHLFQNLISNAIKFRGVGHPVVTITVEERADGVLLVFKDNGIGIPTHLLEHVFGLGARLHTREEYSGLGLGLALCRRIVEQHGGRIWAESGEAGGSSFHVLLPRNSSQTAPSGVM